MRIPVSVTFALAPKDTLPNQKFVAKEQRGKSIWEIVDNVIDECAKRGFMVMLDMHNLGPQLSTELWVSLSLVLELSYRLEAPYTHKKGIMSHLAP